MQKKKDPLETLRKNLYSIMCKKDWSTLHLATACGISYETLMRIISRRSDSVRLRTIINISENLGIPVYELFDDRKAV